MRGSRSGSVTTSREVFTQTTYSRLLHTRSDAQMRPVTTKWFKYLLAILLGNGLYFALNPYLPPAAKHHPFKLDLGTLVDFWLCLVVYGLLELGAFLQKRGQG